MSGSGRGDGNNGTVGMAGGGSIAAACAGKGVKASTGGALGLHELRHGVWRSRWGSLAWAGLDTRYGGRRLSRVSHFSLWVLIPFLAFTGNNLI